MVGGGWVKSYLRTRIARSVPSVRRLTHQSGLHLIGILVSLLQVQVPHGPLAGCSRVFFHLFVFIFSHIFNYLSSSFIFFHFLSFVPCWVLKICFFWPVSGGTPLGLFFFMFSSFVFFLLLCSLFFFFLPSSVALITITVVISWLSVGHRLVICDDQVESRIWWAAGGSSPSFVPESPD